MSIKTRPGLLQSPDPERPRCCPKWQTLRIQDSDMQSESRDQTLDQKEALWDSGDDIDDVPRLVDGVNADFLV